MNKREVVKLAIEGREVPYVPWACSFTVEAAEKLKEHFGQEDLVLALDDHFVRLGSDIGFFEDLGNNRFRDVFGVVWDRTIDKDIGNAEGHVLAEPTLKGYQFPDPRNHRFFDDIPAKIDKYGAIIKPEKLALGIFIIGVTASLVLLRSRFNPAK